MTTLDFLALFLVFMTGVCVGAVWVRLVQMAGRE